MVEAEIIVRMVEDPEINEKGSLASLENIAYEKSGRDFAYFIDKYSARNGLLWHNNSIWAKPLVTYLDCICL